MWEKSRRMFEEALNLFPGGVNSPVRAAVKPYPFYVERGEGAYVYTVDGARLADYVMAYGPLILGHRHPKVLERVREQVERGWIYGTPSEVEVELARKITRYYRTDMVRFVNSGTEATVTAVRLARGFTKRKHVVKFEGCYHGANDSLLVKAGSAATHYGVATSAGVPDELASLTYVLPYNDVDAFERFMAARGDEIAAIIVEPVAANMGLVPSKPEFLKALRDAADEHGALLVFDEVVTGFRLALGGAQEYYGIRADITTLGKIIGGGFPVGAVTARREIMELLAPKGPVFNAGTFNAHPVSMAAGLATIEAIEQGGVYEVANEAARRVAEALDEVLGARGIDHTVNRVASMLQVFFVKGGVESYADALRSDRELYAKLHALLAERGVFIPPSQFETWFTSSSHTEAVVDETVSALEEAVRAL